MTSKKTLTQYWHKKKDAWQNIFKCECYACTNHNGHMPDPPATTETNAIEETAPRLGHSHIKRQDLTKENQEPNQETSMSTQTRKLTLGTGMSWKLPPPQEPPNQFNLQQRHLQCGVTKGPHKTLDTTALRITKQISRTTCVHYP